MSRVGRWDEPYKRIVAGDTEIIDKARAFTYSTILNKYNNEKAAADKVNQQVKDMEIQKRLEEEKASLKKEKKKQAEARNLQKKIEAHELLLKMFENEGTKKTRSAKKNIPADLPPVASANTTPYSSVITTPASLI